MRRAEFVIPGKIPSAANLREHWRARHRRAKDQRRTAHLVARTYVGLTLTGLSLSSDILCFGGTVTLTRVSPRKLDSDNLASSLKAVRDGIADAIGIDDGDERIEWRYGQARCKRGEQAVSVVVESARPRA